jgi:hypothetical protein
MPNMVAVGASGVLSTPRDAWVGLSKYIRRGWRFFSSHTRFDPGDGLKIKFWDNVWCCKTSLKVTFPILYNFAFVKEATMATNMDLSNGTL